MTDFPHRRGEIFDARRDEGWAVYEEETDSLHILNESARAIWELCDGATSPSEIAHAISELTGIGYETVLADVTRTLSELDERGLVELGSPNR